MCEVIVIILATLCRLVSISLILPELEHSRPSYTACRGFRVSALQQMQALLVWFGLAFGDVTPEKMASWSCGQFQHTQLTKELYRKAKTTDALFNPRAEPTTTRTAWDKVRDNLGRDADTQQVFVDILANDVIKPLEKLKHPCSNGRVTWKKVKDNARGCINENLDISASHYAEHAEKRVLKLQQAYLKKNRSQQHAYSSNISRRPQGVPDSNKRFGRRMSALVFRGQREDQREPEPVPSEEGISNFTLDFTIGSQLGLLNQQSASVSDDICREAVADLNKFRIFRAENLEEGYDLLEGLVFMPTIKDVLVKYIDGMIKACAKHDDLARSTGAQVVNVLGGTETSDLRVSFRRALSFSTPPLTLYCNYRPSGYSHLVFGVPLADHGVTDGRQCSESDENVH
ncbi:hypothetical protein V8E53_002156 [Lactarius tabidus]